MSKSKEAEKPQTGLEAIGGFCEQIGQASGPFPTIADLSIEMGRTDLPPKKDLPATPWELARAKTVYSKGK